MRWNGDIPSPLLSPHLPSVVFTNSGRRLSSSSNVCIFTAPFFVVLCPFVERHGQRDGRWVQQFDSHLETEPGALPYRLLSKMSKQCIEYPSEHATVPFCILISYSWFKGSATDSKVVQIAIGWIQSIGDITYRVASRELAEHHAYELPPCDVTFAVLIRFFFTDNFSYAFFREFTDCLYEKCYICKGK